MNSWYLEGTSMNRHQIIDQRIFRIHELVVEQLDLRPDFVIETGRDNLKRWRTRGVWNRWYEQWNDILTRRSVPEIRSLLLTLPRHHH